MGEQCANCILSCQSFQWGDLLNFSRQPAFRFVEQRQRILSGCPFLQPLIDIFYVGGQRGQVGFAFQYQGETAAFGAGIVGIVQCDE